MLYMNGIDKIIAHIKADSDAECKAIADEAAAKCEEIRAQCEQAARVEHEKIITKGKQDAETRIDRLNHVAELEGKKQILAVKQEMVSLAFERAVQMITELPEDQYISLLVRLASSASRTGNEQIILSAGDRARFGKAVCVKANEVLASSGKEANLKLSEQTRNIRGGLILSSGDIEVNCSTDALVMQLKNELSSKVAGVLFD
jgi:V/A-type H+-transporting ATPase subunit E